MYTNIEFRCCVLPAAVRSTISCWPPARRSEITVSPSSCTDRMPRARSAALPSAASWRRRVAAAIGMDSVTRTLFHGSTCAGWMGMLVVSTTRPQPAGEPTPSVEGGRGGAHKKKTRKRLGEGFWLQMYLVHCDALRRRRLGGLHVQYGREPAEQGVEVARKVRVVQVALADHHG